MYEDADEVDSLCSIQPENVVLTSKIERRSSSLRQFPHEVELRFASNPNSARQRKNLYKASEDSHVSGNVNQALEDSIHQHQTETTNMMKSNNDPKQLLTKNRKWQLFRQILCIDCC